MSHEDTCNCFICNANQPMWIHVKLMTSGALEGMTIETKLPFYREPGFKCEPNKWTGAGYTLIDCYPVN